MTYKSEFLNILSERGFLHQCSDFEELDKKLMGGVQSAYIGFDPTAKSLHVGNLVNIMMLKWFQETGHKPITLMGGGTSKIGDPSFKDEQRKLLTDDMIRDNMENVRTTCFTQFLKYGNGPADAVMVNNDDWLSELKYLDFLRDYGRYFTVNRMISFDSVKTRLERESPLTLLEFNYMVMQGYDFLELYRRNGTILQMGGSDQWGNMINGVDLAHKSDQAQLFVLTTPLLLNSAGEKMGKTVNGAVWLNKNMLSAYDYWQYFRNVGDSEVANLLAKFTMLPMSEVNRLAALQGSEINEAKKVLAHEATKLCHGEQAAIEAAETAKKVFEQGGVGSNLPTIYVNPASLEAGMLIVDLLADPQVKLTSSKSEARRQIEQNAVKCNGVVITDIMAKITKNDLTAEGYIKISKGSKHHALVKPDSEKSWEAIQKS